MKSRPFFLLSFLPVVSLLAASAHADTLTALGRVVPVSGVVDVVGAPGDTVEAILVKEGDWVDAGQPLARLSSAGKAELHLAQVKGDLASLKKIVESDEALARERVSEAEQEEKFANDKMTRLLAAGSNDFISPDQIEDRTLSHVNAVLKLGQAREDLVKAGRDDGRALRDSELEVAAAESTAAAANARAPIHARVLKIYARKGGTVGANPLFKLGDTSSMMIVAEIYEGDSLKVKVGQTATMSSNALPKKMTGTVVSKSSMVARNSLESIDPNESSQARVVEVTIKADDAEPLDQLVLLQLDVAITL
jgi:HlyD family secretion protein